MSESNRLATVSEALEKLGVTSSLSPNKAITVAELEELISKATISKESIEDILNYMKVSEGNLVIVVNDYEEVESVKVTFYSTPTDFVIETMF